MNDAQIFILCAGALVWTFICCYSGMEFEENKKPGAITTICIVGALCLFAVACMALFNLVAKNL